jgi:predicted transcriptional regulator
MTGHSISGIEFLENDLKISRQTAAKYLDALAHAGFLQKARMGKSNYYINTTLFQLLANVPTFEERRDR